MTDTVEVWRQSPTLPTYIVSSKGRVMRIPHWEPGPNGGLRSFGGEPYFGTLDVASNRFKVRVSGKAFKVSRLICEAFHGPAPRDKPVCMHLDEDSQNNSADNLAWGSQSENLNAPGYQAWSRSDRPRRRLSPSEMSDLLRRRATGESGQSLSRRFEISPSTVSRILAKRPA